MYFEIKTLFLSFTISLSGFKSRCDFRINVSTYTNLIQFKCDLENLGDSGKSF